MSGAIGHNTPAREAPARAHAARRLPGEGMTDAASSEAQRDGMFQADFPPAELAREGSPT